MAGGDRDSSNPVAHQQAMFRAFGTPEADKYISIYEAGHWPLPMNDVLRDTGDFLDRYLRPPVN